MSRSREGDVMVPVHQVAAEAASAFQDEGGLIRLMVAHVVMTECAKAGYAKKLTLDR